MNVSLDASVLDPLGIPVTAGIVLALRVSPVNGFAYVIADGFSSTGNIGGIAGADHQCDPTDTGKRKAFLMAATRYACSTPNCSQAGETGPADWVLFPNTTYVNAAGLLLFTTDATHPIFTAWPMANTYKASSLNFLFGGNVSWQATTFACADWNNGSAGTYNCGFENSSTNGWIDGGTLACNALRPVLCVDQPPATLPATH